MEDDYGPDFEIAEFAEMAKSKEFRHCTTFSGEPAIIVDSRVPNQDRPYPGSFVEAVRDKESEFSKWCRDFGISKSYATYKAWCREVGIFIDYKLR